MNRKKERKFIEKGLQKTEKAQRGVTVAFIYFRKIITNQKMTTHRYGK